MAGAIHRKKLSHSLVNGNSMSAAWIKTSEHEYDKLGQLKTKNLGRKKDAAGAYTSTPREILSYDYNIRGWLLGVNKDEVINANGTSARNFGFELGYDKTSNASGRTYTAAQFNGNINGMIWKSNGDGNRRKYDFSYDAANRLMQGLFEQNNNDNSWNNSIVNYQVKMGDGINVSTAYDANGNIQKMQQWGLKVTGSTQIDNLTYNYLNTGNRLLNVGDAFNDAQTKLGDFRVSALHPTQTKITTTVDYSYDVNGNMVKDINKDLVQFNGSNGIVYNHLNLPAQITVKKSGTANKGTITYTYDAAGNKLKKVVVDNTSTTVQVTTTSLYMAGMVYESKVSVPANSATDYTDRLQFIGHEEGRIRFIPTVGSIPAKFEFDYFIKDHLGNVRMVLTEEVQQDIYPAATLEGSISTDAYPNAIFKEKDYYTINTANVVPKTDATGIPDYPNNNVIPNNNSYSNTTAVSQKLYKLQATASGGVNGLGMLLKVMSGDKIDIHGKSYYFQNNAAAVNYQLPVMDIFSGILGAPASAAIGKTTATELNGITGIASAVSVYLANTNRNNGGTSTTPKAYINYILLDETFKFVDGSFSRVGGANSVKSHFDDANMQNINVNKNGYIYVYVSNESPVAVFFDNLQVVHTRGPILEETHYYPFGMVMAGISSKAAGKSENKYKFNGIEQNNDFEINMYDAQFRNLDPQIGRFWQSDPKPTDELSVYSAMNNNPLRYSDPLGDTIIIRYTSEGKTVESIYQDGTFFKRDGSNLSKDDNGYASKVFSDIFQLDQSGDKEVSKRIDVLEDSKNLHFIQMPGSGENNGNFPTSSADDKAGKPTGSTTKYNPDAKTNARREKRDPIVGLAHELLGHGYDSDRGKSDYSKTKNGISMYEVSAVNIENHVRAKVGDPKKTTYGGQPIPANLLQDTHKKNKKK